MDCKKIYEEADKAGKNAAKNLVIFPIFLEENGKRVEHNGEGSAWININENTKFGRYCKKNKLSKSDPYGGQRISILDYEKNIQRKQAYAVSFVEVLSKYKIVAASMSMLD